MIIICDYIYDFLFPRSAVIFGVLGRRFINRFWEGEIMLTPPPSGHSYYCELAPVSWFSLSMLFPIELIQNRDELCWIFFFTSSSSFFPFFFSFLSPIWMFAFDLYRIHSDCRSFKMAAILSPSVKFIPFRFSSSILEANFCVTVENYIDFIDLVLIKSQRH